MDHDANTTTPADPTPAGHRPRRRLVAAVVAGGLLVGGGAAYAATVARSAGPDYVYGSPNAFRSASASVQVVTTGGRSTVTLKVRGVDAPAGQTFGAHVHQLPCGELATASGGHYAHAGAAGTLRSREVWLDVRVKGNGRGQSTAVRPWVLDQSTPRSVVIHALPTDKDTGMAGARLACIDLDGVA